MNVLQSDLVKISNEIPYYYLQDLLDYAIFLKVKSKKENDTEYLESIPGMVDSIIAASKEELNNCSKSPGW
ncbi:MAG: hypothetical protein A2X61_16070 [Ignavibacteria bacterium GWB2_35_12]|nr:MAG: hypothetical protein A2X61_16070 [Ignavibacteria bacterium GWB2_35_12]OGU91444.1 MAG: hypothetical protein A2220_08675 [Ignavibacteria bacterium RIFOXYA2_FULL_35_10]OGV22230.1 MAG: hypothetical protein A2475_06975 [Ignavibacteria bacterium RIFOXYC2_FULL_35_21]